MPSIWPLVHAERLALADQLWDVPAQAWERPSLVPGWSVHDVLTHLVDVNATTWASFAADMLACRGDFDAANARGMRRHRRDSPAETIADFAATALRRSGPPGPLATRAVEMVVHGEDLRRPIGLTHAYAPRLVAAAWEYQLAAPASIGGSRERVAGLRLAPDDLLLPSSPRESAEAVDDQRPVVTGAAIDLLLAACGRPVPADALDGNGAPILRGRA